MTPKKWGSLFAFITALTTYNSTSSFADDLQSLTTAAERGDAASAFKLGQAYAEGTGVPRSYTEAAKWYRSAAEHWYGPAQNSLGILFATGQGVPQDAVYGLVWFRFAALTLARQGDALRDNAKRLEQRMSSTQIRRSFEISVRCVESVFKDCTNDEQSETATFLEPSKQPSSPPALTSPVALNSHRITADDYPKESISIHQQGTVKIAYVVGEDGTPSACVIVMSSGYPRLDEAACGTVKKRWRWKPGTLDGKPLAMVLSSDVAYMLR